MRTVRADSQGAYENNFFTGPPCIFREPRVSCAHDIIRIYGHLLKNRTRTGGNPWETPFRCGALQVRRGQAAYCNYSKNQRNNQG